jgi:hypothetical protein
MKPETHSIFGISKQRGIWLRCFLDATGFAIVATLSLPQFAHTQGIVDCVYPGRVSVSRVEGQVFDPSGTVVPGVIITLADERGSKIQTTTDGQGRFRLAASPGEYSFTAVVPMFQTSQTRLNVGEDLAGLFHPSNLRVILGMAGSFCPWVTTSQREFRDVISSNKKRIEEAAQGNATQK